MVFYQILFFFLVIVPSAIIHEYAHGWAADRLGDPTAKYAGRLTLDPRVHIDLWGTIVMPVALLIITSGAFMFAYAKPVPYNPFNLKNHKWGPAMVAIAGPLANLLLAFVFAVVLKFLPAGAAIAPFLEIIVLANVLLMIFNLIPIPPLDGSKVLYALLPPSAHNIRMFLDRYGFIILLIFIFFLFDLISPIINWVMNILLNI